jgi:hypothetical protein
VSAPNGQRDVHAQCGFLGSGEGRVPEGCRATKACREDFADSIGAVLRILRDVANAIGEEVNIANDHVGSVVDDMLEGLATVVVRVEESDISRLDLRHEKSRRCRRLAMRLMSVAITVHSRGCWRGHSARKVSSEHLAENSASDKIFGFSRKIPRYPKFGLKIIRNPCQLCSMSCLFSLLKSTDCLLFLAIPHHGSRRISPRFKIHRRR